MRSLDLVCQVVNYFFQPGLILYLSSLSNRQTECWHKDSKITMFSISSAFHTCRCCVKPSILKPLNSFHSDKTFKWLSPQKSNWLNPRKHPDIPMKIHNSARPVTGWFSVGSRSASNSSWEQKTSEKNMNVYCWWWLSWFIKHLLGRTYAIVQFLKMWFWFVKGYSIAAICDLNWFCPWQLLHTCLLPQKAAYGWVDEESFQVSGSVHFKSKPSFAPCDIPLTHIISYPQTSKIHPSKIPYDLRRCLGYDVGAKHLIVQVFGCVSLEYHLITSHANPSENKVAPVSLSVLACTGESTTPNSWIMHCSSPPWFSKRRNVNGEVSSCISHTSSWISGVNPKAPEFSTGDSQGQFLYRNNAFCL